MASVSVHKRGEIWVVRERVKNPAGGRSQPSHSFKRYADAKAFEAEARVRLGVTGGVRSAYPVFDVWAADYMSAQLQWEPPTRDRNASHLKVHVLPAFSGMAINVIDRARVQRWVNGLSERMAPASVHNVYYLFRPMMSLALNDGLLSRDPCISIKLPEIPRTEAGFLRSPQIAPFIRSFPERDMAFVATAIYTGLRWQELVALRPEDIDLGKGLLHIRGAVRRNRGRPERKAWGKSESAMRSLVIFDMLRPVFEHQLNAAASEWVFPALKGGILNYSNWLRRTWNQTLPKTGLHKVAPRITPHSCRHTCAALLIDKDWNAYQLQRWFGHSDIRVVFRYYGHLLEKHDPSIARTFEDVDLGDLLLAGQTANGSLP